MIGKLLFFFFLFIYGLVVRSSAQENEELSPIEKAYFLKNTPYVEVEKYIDKLSSDYTNMHVDIIGKSVQGRKIQMVHVIPDMDKGKIKVLLIGQQHGNEPAGKESLLMLLQNIAKGTEDSILTNIDLYVIPMVNPDGNEAGKRANANGEDLNRDHLLMTQPEVIAVQKVYAQIDPDVTLDVHEYSAFRKEFRNAGYIRTDDEEFGAPTNLNISPEMRNYALGQLFPYLNTELGKKGVSFSNYYKMNNPDDSVRASSTAIDDGRQSLAILGSFSFILEGRDGRNMNDELKRRVTREIIAIEKFLEFVNMKNREIKTLVAEEKKHLMESTAPVALQMDYVFSGNKIGMSMQMLDSKTDTVIQLPYSPVVKVFSSVNRPEAYYIPKAQEEVIKFLDLHGIKYIKTKKIYSLSVEKYSVLDKRKVWMENKSFMIPALSSRNENITTEQGDIIVPLNQRAGILTIIALEPSSMWGLSQSDEFKFLCRKGSDYPVFRVPVFKVIGNDN